VNSLEQIIIEKIKREGPITFETFMDMALYYPGFGYYASSETTIGREGDYYTGPHLHPIFGAMIGRQFMEMWMTMGRPFEFYAVEIGAGLGYLCKDIIDYLHRPCKNPQLSRYKSDFLKSLRYVIVEPYDHFREKQKELLADLLKNLPSSPFTKGWNKSGEKEQKSNNFITWVNSLNELDDVVGCFFSNELLDAFPVHMVEMEDELKEVYAAFDGRDLIEEKNKPASGDIADYFKQFSINIQRGYRTEINLRIRNWLSDINAALLRGYVLTVDYGYSAKEYYSEERTKGTLLCYRKHQFNESPYLNIGKQDITAHVNFSSLKKWGEELGLKTSGYCAQGAFLISAGIDEVITELYSDSPDYLSEVSKIKGLIMPQGMGESHSVMIQHKGEGLPELRGFSMRNIVENL
jgi:SAM-dependent MidA family methyltransferase